MTSALDPSLCPLCGERNRCGLSQGQTECWCFGVTIQEETLERVPNEAKNLACLCPRCAALQANAEPS
jgi:hypothetical protein